MPASWPPASLPPPTRRWPTGSMRGARPSRPRSPRSPPMTDRLAPGATIGILGGGQLGRMLSVAAARLGFKSCVFEPGGDCPASHVANYHFQAAYEDDDALRRFGEAVDVVTYEFENIPTSALDILEGLV